jgi:hypothetical protein
MHRAPEAKAVVFRYNDNVLPLIMGVLLWLMVLAVIICSPFDSRSDFNSIVNAELIFIFVFVGYTLGLVNAYIRYSNIVVDEEGMKRSILGKERYNIRWQDIKRIRILATPNFTGGPPIDVYYIDKTVESRFPYSKGGPIVFNSKLENLSELLRIINVNISKYNIPILDRRSKQESTLSRL